MESVTHSAVSKLTYGYFPAIGDAVELSPASGSTKELRNSSAGECVFRLGGSEWLCASIGGDPPNTVALYKYGHTCKLCHSCSLVVVGSHNTPDNGDNDDNSHMGENGDNCDMSNNSNDGKNSVNGNNS